MSAVGPYTDDFHNLIRDVTMLIKTPGGRQFGLQFYFRFTNDSPGFSHAELTCLMDCGITAGLCQENPGELEDISRNKT